MIRWRRIDPNPHQRLVEIGSQSGLQQGQKRESVRRERIPWVLLELGDPRPFVVRFLFEARAWKENPRGQVPGTVEGLNPCLGEVFQTSRLSAHWPALGIRWARQLSSTTKGSLSYALRNAKNPEDFYRVLNDAQFRLQITVPEALLRIERGERIAGAPWVRVKTLPSIYAMKSYLRSSRREEVSAPISQSTASG